MQSARLRRELLSCSFPFALEIVVNTCAAALKLLFICTHNRCRSILAEAIANHVGEGLLLAASAGSSPAGNVHPLTLQSLARHGIPVTGLRSKSWDELEDFAPDIVITVCDNAAGESCPLCFGRTDKVHWGLVDPSVLADNAQPADAEAVQSAFDQTIGILSARLRRLRQALAQPLNDHELTLLLQKLSDSNTAR